MKCASVLFVSVVAGSATSVLADPSLVGDTILRVTQPQLTGVVGDPQYAVVTDPGTEYIDTFDFAGEYRRFNIGPTSIRMENTSAWFSPWFDSGNLPSYIEFRDLDFGEPGWSIVGVNVTWGGAISVESGAPLNYPSFGPNAVIFNADTVRLYIGPYRFEEGSWVQIDLVLAPAPTSAALAGLGVLGAARRRRR